MSQIIDFYTGNGADHRGRKLDQILAWDEARLEDTHDYIQWLFPLPEPSRFNPHAPLLTPADCAEFDRRSELRANMLRAFRRMLAFYGCGLDELSGDDMPIVSAPGGKRRDWLAPGDHNYLRITRMLTSLRLLGLGQYADAFFAALAELYKRHPSAISATTFAYWRQAVVN